MTSVIPLGLETNSWVLDKEGIELLDFDQTVTDFRLLFNQVSPTDSTALIWITDY